MPRLGARPRLESIARDRRKDFEARETLRSLAESARSLTGAMFVVVATPGPDGAFSFRVLAGDDRGYTRAIRIETDAESALGRGPGGRAFREGCPVVVADTLADPSFAPWREEAARRGIRSVAFVPVRFRGEVLGVFGAYHDREDAFTDDRIGLLETLSHLAGSALGFAELSARLQRRVDDLAVFERVGRFITTLAGEQETLDFIADQVRDLLECDAVMVCTLGEGESELITRSIRMAVPNGVRTGTRSPVDRAMLDRYRTRQVRYVPDLAGDTAARGPLREAGIALGMRAGYVVPLVAGDEVLGHMVVAFRDAHPFRADEERALRILADYAAICVANARLYDQARLEAHVDSLTGLWNHRSLLKFISHEMAAARFSGRELALLFVDLDGFKAINDGWGHPEGDALLREMAGVIRRTVPEGCYACRYGGDEFAVLFPGAGYDAALAVGESLRAAIADAGRRFIPPGARPVTSSIGLACFPADAQSISGLVGKADHAMYAAKTSGRNRVCAYGALAG